MLKKHLLLLMLFVMAVASVNASTWKLHHCYVTANMQNVIDAGDKVYYVNSKNLYQFDKETQTTIALNSLNMLSEDLVSQIYYDDVNDLLFVAYTSANIDVIDGSGKVTNISGVSNAIIRVYNYTLDSDGLVDYNEKIINDITFHNGIAYVAVGYGYITIDESTMRITSNKLVGRRITVNSVAVVGDRLLVLSNKNCYYGPVTSDEDPVSSFDKYEGSFSGGKVFPIDDNSAFVLGKSALYNFNFSSGSLVVTSLVSAAATNVQKTSTGFIANFAGQKYYYTIDPTGMTATKVGTVAAFASSNPYGDGTVWVTDANGLHTANSTTYYKVNSMTSDILYWLKYDTALDLLYAGVSARNGLTVTGGTPANVINTYNGTEWANATAYTASGAGYEFVILPMDSTTYVRASWTNGIHKVKNNELKLNYTKSNSLMGTYKAQPAFDMHGNMWIVSSYGNSTCPVAMLPADKVVKNSVSKTDWFQPSGLTSLNTGSMQRSRFLISHKNNVKIYNDGDYLGSGMNGRFLCWSNFNEVDTLDNYTLVDISHFVDQNNGIVSWIYFRHMEEDANGLIWVGHNGGLFVLDPDVLFNDHPNVVRPYVTGSGADNGYLCEGYDVYDIGVDRENNKWIATNNGLYFVSPDGTRVYNHFTTSNSDIPDNLVYGVECDVKHDRVYIVTASGIAEYIAEGDAAAMDLNSVYAFPNPVEPDFTGMIKIANLMVNSYVTITNREGEVVKQLGPGRGSVLWDGSGSDGERVPTGLYNVYVAEDAQPAITGTPNTTLMIIK
jgi:hypothetical protein